MSGDGVVDWIHRAVEPVARAIHDEAGGCCEYGFDGCDSQDTARDAAVVALAGWFSASLRATPPGRSTDG